MGVLTGDFIGFSYNGVHSSELGIMRTSEGSRFNENLLPTSREVVVQVPGGDGTYYFGSYYTQRQFSISFAFDDLTEAEIATLKAHFGDKGIHDLIFDETPYKIYSAKVTGTATIKYLAFDEGVNKKRVYKGEGTIQFTCYNPFARCAFSSKEINDNINEYKSLDKWKDELRNTYPNLDEWWDAARIEPNKNFGDVPVSFTLEFPENTEGNITIDNTEITWNLKGEPSGVLDTKTGLAVTGNKIINNKLTGNLLAKIPVGYTVEPPTNGYYPEFVVQYF